MFINSMEQTTKQTIKKTIEQVKAKISGINHIEKQSGTNVWFIQAKFVSPEEAALELRDEFGFKVIAVNQKNSVIIAERNQ